MAEINAALVKELRKRTVAGIMECKKALVEARGDIERAIDNMRKSGQAKAEKKADRLAAEGMILNKISADRKYGVIVEVNCETDFVAKGDDFKAFSEEVATTTLNERISDIKILRAKFEEQRIALVARVSENINIRRISIQEGDELGTYLHGARIGVLVAAKGANEELIKHIAMHIAASKPEYVKDKDVPDDVIARERQVQLEIAMHSCKPLEIEEKIVDGRMRKFIDEISLTGQYFVMNPNKKVGDLLKEHKANIISFTRFEVGERIKNAEVDLADKVEAISKQP
ncbi:MAG: translation elongation factor Ts [Candidatus Malihini olakiniferum]